MVPREVIDQVRKIPIPGFLESLGLRCIRHSRNNLRFENPLRNDAIPSFDICIKKNVWLDRGTGEGGDIIELVRRIRKCTFPEAVAELTKQIHSFSFRQPFITKPTESVMEHFRVEALTHSRLVAYLKKRRIDPSIARLYVKEAHYQINGKPYYTLAFPSRNGGYELRNAFFKGCYGSKAISVFKASERSKSILLFEGFMDFLTYLTRAKQSHPKDHVLVLNSTALVTDSLLEKISGFTVHAYLDNDQAGKQTITRLEENQITVSDHSIEYEGYKDLNEYYMHTVSW